MIEVKGVGDFGGERGIHFDLEDVKGTWETSIPNFLEEAEAISSGGILGFLCFTIV